MWRVCTVMLLVTAACVLLQVLLHALRERAPPVRPPGDCDEHWHDRQTPPGDACRVTCLLDDEGYYTLRVGGVSFGQAVGVVTSTESEATLGDVSRPTGAPRHDIVIYAVPDGTGRTVVHTTRACVLSVGRALVAAAARRNELQCIV